MQSIKLELQIDTECMTEEQVKSLIDSVRSHFRFEVAMMPRVAIKAMTVDETFETPAPLPFDSVNRVSGPKRLSDRVPKQGMYVDPGRIAPLVADFAKEDAKNTLRLETKRLAKLPPSQIPYARDTANCGRIYKRQMNCMCGSMCAEETSFMSSVTHDMIGVHCKACGMHSYAVIEVGPPEDKFLATKAARTQPPPAVRDERPCALCNRPNDVGVKVCWCCGGAP